MFLWYNEEDIEPVDFTPVSDTLQFVSKGIFAVKRIISQDLSTQIKCTLVHSLFWASYCAYSSFIVTMLTDYGYSSATATAMMTATSVLSFIAQPVSGYICDNYIPHKWVYIILTICAIPTMVLMPHLLFSPVLTMISMLLFTVFMVQMPGLLDAWVIGLTNLHPHMNYGISRGSSSLAFAIAAQVMGGLTAVYGHGMRCWVGAVLGLLSVIVAFMLEPLPCRRSQEAKAENKPVKSGLSTAETVSRLVKNHAYILLLLMSFLLFMGTSCFSSFIPVLTQELGGGSGEVGTVFALTALSEVPAMFLMASILRKVPAKKVIVLAGLFYLLRLSLTAVAPNYIVMLLVQMFQGLSFAVIWPASMAYLNQIMDYEVRSTAIMTFSSVTLGISGIFGNAIGTAVLAATNVRMVFVFASVSAGVGLALGLYGLVRRIWK